MRLPHRSVRLRVTSAATALVCIGLAVAGVTTVQVLRHSLASDTDAVLADRLDELQLLIADGQLGEVIEATGRETGQLQVIAQDGSLVAASPGLADAGRLDAIDAPPMGQEHSDTVDGTLIGGRSGERFRVVARTVPSARGAMTIYGVTSLRAADRTVGHVTHVLAIGLPLLALLAGLLIWWVVGRALAPVDAMRRVVDEIEGTELGRRVDVGSNDDEIGRLGVTLNRMLERLDDATARQRLFAAAASHELRSPLSAIRTELEVGMTYPDRTDWAVVAGESLVEVERLEALARDLLELTRLQAGEPSIGRTPASAEVLDLADVVREVLAKRSSSVSLERRAELGEAWVRGDRDLLVRMVRNLLDNAERHATSRVDVAVTTTTEPAGPLLARLRVWNDGPPIAAADREAIFDPFTRLDDARALDEGGAGLGLAIARSVAMHVGGDLRAVDTDTGAGFEATIPTV